MEANIINRWEVVCETIRPRCVVVCARYDTKKEAVKHLDRLFFAAQGEGKVATWNREADVLSIGPNNRIRATKEYYCRPVEEGNHK